MSADVVSMDARNTGLLSFGEDAEAGEDVGIKKKAMTRPDCMFSSPTRLGGAICV
jgi:hypothetical protein